MIFLWTAYRYQQFWNAALKYYIYLFLPLSLSLNWLSIFQALRSVMIVSWPFSSLNMLIRQLIYLLCNYIILLNLLHLVVSRHDLAKKFLNFFFIYCTIKIICWNSMEFFSMKFISNLAIYNNSVKSSVFPKSYKNGIFSASFSNREQKIIAGSSWIRGSILWNAQVFYDTFRCQKYILTFGVTANE